jgi:hypothetical protein
LAAMPPVPPECGRQLVETLSRSGRGLEYEPRAPALLAPASDVDKDAAAAEAIDPDVAEGVQPRGQHDIIHR